ncbi:lactate permease [Bacillus sp. M6-12]|uniref:L-lactate permease n=1 Tax=Bacillus sp. M6-12 TaxID=2054166 RepID=UPI000C77718F|nr:L-lactate permease [Bacillus sp. M6-12]PLS16793.1 lactate permease [Bacillus sp. M6-12]
MDFILAIAPILIVFVLLFVFKQTSLKAGMGAFLLAGGIALFSSPFHLEWGQIAQASVKGALVSFIAAYVLFFGILLFHLMKNIGAINQMASFISRATNNQIFRVIILVIGFSPLVESASGFGIAFMVVAPILVELGFTPFKASLIGLVSLLAVPWGALATGAVIGANLSGVPLENLGAGSAIISTPVFFYLLLISVFIAGGWQAVKENWKHVLIFSLLFALSIYFFSAFVSVELAGVLSSLVTTGLGLFLIRFTKEVNKKDFVQISERAEADSANILKALSPYILLTFFILLTRLIPGIRHLLTSYGVLDLPAFSFSLALLYSPGFWLFITCMITVATFKIQPSVVYQSWKSTVSQWIPFTITTTSYVAMSEVMSASGMINFLSNSAGAAFGSSFIIISGLIAGMGGFLTGSNAGSNAMFIKLQVQTASNLGLNPDYFAFIQNTAASHSTMASPSRVMLGASIFNIQSEEGQLIKKMSAIAAGSLVIVICVVYGWMMLEQ